MDWAPFDFVYETGQYAGVANDYLKVIGERLGIEVEIVTGPSWEDFFQLLVLLLMSNPFLDKSDLNWKF